VRRGPLIGLRPRVLGGYLLLVGLALVLTSVVTFTQADRQQRDAIDVELREEVRDFAAGIQAGRNDGSPRASPSSRTSMRGRRPTATRWWSPSATIRCARPVRSPAPPTCGPWPCPSTSGDPVAHRRR